MNVLIGNSLTKICKLAKSINVGISEWCDDTDCCQFPAISLQIVIDSTTYTILDASTARLLATNLLHFADELEKIHKQTEGE